MTNESTESQADLASLRQLAEIRRSEADSADTAIWERLIARLNRLAQPYTPLLVVSADPSTQWAPEGIRTASATLEDVVKDPALVVGTEHIIMTMSPGRILTQGEIEALQLALARRPSKLWRIAVVGSHRLRDQDQVSTQLGILDRMGSMLGGDSSPAAPLLLGQASDAEEIGERLASDQSAMMDWLRTAAPTKDVQEADRALLEDLVKLADARHVVSQKTSPAAQENEGIDLAALEKRQAAILERLAAIVSELGATIPKIAAQFSGSHIASGLHETEGGARLQQAVAKRLADLWGIASADLRRRFQDRLGPWREWAIASLQEVDDRAGTTLASVELAVRSAPQPEWSSVPQVARPDGQTTLQTRAGAAAVGGLLGAVATKPVVGLLIGGTAGFLAAPWLMGIVDSATGHRRPDASEALAKGAEIWRSDAELALRQLLAAMHTETARAVTDRIGRFTESLAKAEDSSQT